jgi:hypothetical protein
MKRCGSTLHYEQFQGMRLFRGEGRKQVYRYWCPGCKTYGENNGRALTCGVKREHVPGQARRDHLVQG